MWRFNSNANIVVLLQLNFLPRQPVFAGYSLDLRSIKITSGTDLDLPSQTPKKGLLGMTIFISLRS